MFIVKSTNLIKLTSFLLFYCLFSGCESNYCSHEYEPYRRFTDSLLNDTVPLPYRNAIKASGCREEFSSIDSSKSMVLYYDFFNKSGQEYFLGSASYFKLNRNCSIIYSTNISDFVRGAEFYESEHLSLSEAIEVAKKHSHPDAKCVYNILYYHIAYESAEWLICLEYGFTDYVRQDIYIDAKTGELISSKKESNERDLLKAVYFSLFK